MKEIFHGLLIITPFAALVLFFSIQGKEEVKAEQRLFQATQAQEQQNFDDQFDEAWNGEPGSKIRKQRAENLAELHAEIEKSRAKRNELDGIFEDAARDMTQAIKEEELRQAASAVPASNKTGGSNE